MLTYLTLFQPSIPLMQKTSAVSMKRQRDSEMNLTFKDYLFSKHIQIVTKGILEG